MKYILIVIALALTGCASLQNAGNANYQLRQITDSNGKTGFDIIVKNGKEIASVKVHLEKDGEQITVDLEETGVAAFAGQQIASDAMKIASEQAAKAAVAAALGVASGGALPVIGEIMQGGGLGAGLIGAGAGAAGVLGAKKIFAPDPVVPPVPAP